ncbi:MAG: hypothetical protein ACYCYI_11830 [Saccharofermentanales bacterium]
MVNSKDIREFIESKYRRKVKKDELFNIMDMASDEELMGLMDEINQSQYKNENEKN